MPEVTKTIDSDITILDDQPIKTIDSDTLLLSKFIDIEGEFSLVKLAEKDLEGETAITQTTPTAPVLATAIDLKLGDVVRLVWSGSGPFYNVYYKVTGPGAFTKANANVLGGATVQYDVGGLTTGSSYTFMIRGVNGEGTESVDSNTLDETPTFDSTASRFSNPTWSVKINTVTNSDVVLANVVTSYGGSTSKAVFDINQDPDTGTFPSYNDNVEVIVNGRSIFKGKIKGITSRIATSGLRKTFTALANITILTETVVDPKNKDFNDDTIPDDEKLTTNQILASLLGYTPAGSPTDDPGEIHLTDMTLLDAAQTILNKVGNYKLFWNKDTDLLEVYKFGEGGDITRQFTKGVNIIDLAITENRQSVVDKIAIVGPNKAVRTQKIVGVTLEPDENGVYRLAFELEGKNIRDIVVEGQYRDRPSYEHDGRVQVTPEDMGFSSTFSSVPGFAEWPYYPFGELGNARGDIGLRPALKSITSHSLQFSPIGASVTYDRQNDKVKIFISDVPKVYFHIAKAAYVANEKIGVIQEVVEIGPSKFLAGPNSSLVRVLTNIQWVRGLIRVTYTEDETCPQISSGSGTVARTITDSQYQIFVDDISTPPFNNETEVLDLMQERADAELEKLNRPAIGGTIMIPGDETVDLKSTVIVGGTKLDVTAVTHNFQRGYTTSIALTNELFFGLTPTISVSRPERRTQQERSAGTSIKFSFEELKIDQDKATQRQIEFQKRLQDAGLSSAIWQD